eukprot:GEMP01022357.1.p1 GENE.GEMP01022357.1~~GEMP01022357.1.p1  ORF type:complete len:360 (+),score=46.28 GEMP01022357.1:69-1148(+)
MLSAGSVACIQAGRAASRSLLGDSLSTLHRCHPAMVVIQRDFRCVMKDREDAKGTPSLPHFRSLVPAGQTRATRSSSWRPPNIDQNFWQKCIGIGAAGYATVKILPGLKFAVPILKVAKVGPLFSMVASGFAYGAVFGWAYGFGMISLIAIHETGHALMMRHLGIPVGPMVFIPFMGASVAMEKFPSNAAHEAAVALAGPILGSVAAFVPLAYGLATGSQLGFALAHWGFMINLFNLLPIGSLDGGRVAGALSKWLLPVGVVGCGGLLYMTPTNPILILIFLGGSYTTFMRFWSPEFRPYGYFDISPGSKMIVGVTYLGLIAALVYAMSVNDRLRRSPQDLLDRHSPVRRQLDDVDRWI